MFASDMAADLYFWFITYFKMSSFAQTGRGDIYLFTNEYSISRLFYIFFFSNPDIVYNWKEYLNRHRLKLLRKHLNAPSLHYYEQIYYLFFSDYSSSFRDEGRSELIRDRGCNDPAIHIICLHTCLNKLPTAECVKILFIHICIYLYKERVNIL